MPHRARRTAELSPRRVPRRPTRSRRRAAPCWHRGSWVCTTARPAPPSLRHRSTGQLGLYGPSQLRDTMAETEDETPWRTRTPRPTPMCLPTTPPKPPSRKTDSGDVVKVRWEAKNLRERLKASETRPMSWPADCILNSPGPAGSWPTRQIFDITKPPGRRRQPRLAIDGLLESKPHLRSRVPRPGNVGQGPEGKHVSLLAHLKSLV